MVRHTRWKFVKQQNSEFNIMFCRKCLKLLCTCLNAWDNCMYQFNDHREENVMKPVMKDLKRIFVTMTKLDCFQSKKESSALLPCMNSDWGRVSSGILFKEIIELIHHAGCFYSYFRYCAIIKYQRSFLQNLSAAF